MAEQTTPPARSREARERRMFLGVHLVALAVLVGVGGGVAVAAVVRPFLGEWTMAVQVWVTGVLYSASWWAQDRLVPHLVRHIERRER